MSQQPTVFISYSHRDEPWKDRLVRQLRVLERQGLLDIWDDRRISAGEDWRAEIEAAMTQARVAVLLVSAHFLSSDFILDEEVPRILRRRESEGLRVIPLLVRPCDWLAVEWLAAIQARPRDGRALSAGDEHQVDSDLASLAAELRELLSSAETLRKPAEAAAELQLKRWDPPAYPADPYPLLLPYDHPELLVGRGRELAELRQRLAKPIPILGLYAPSGAGKSSLLNAGLVPTLRAEGAAVAFDRHPREAGLAGRLIAHLLVTEGNGRPRVDEDPQVFVECLEAVRRLAGEPALVVLDQFEDVLLDAAARARVGVLLASTVKEQLAGEAPLCRWLLAYRQEFHGGVASWLEDVLLAARGARVEVGGLPFDLSSPDRYQGWRLPLLGAPPPGYDEVEVPMGTFRAAIEAPLALVGDDGSLRYPWRFAGDGADRLAHAFAQARLARRDDPLAPELQVVLAHLLHRAGRRDGEVVEIQVPEDPARLIADALADHLRKVLREAFAASGKTGARRGRARALLALRELADAHRRGRGGIPAARLAAAIGEDGEGVIHRLEAPIARLILARQDDSDATGTRYVLAHDSLAEAVVRAVEEEGAKLEIDRELLRLRKLVTLGTELYREGEIRQATDLDRNQHSRVEANSEALLWDKEREKWWWACRQRRRAKRARLWRDSVAVAVSALIIAYFTARWLEDRQAPTDVFSEPRIHLLVPDGQTLPRDHFELRWQGLEEASYDVTVMTTGLEEVAVVTDLGTPELRLEEDDLRWLEPGTTLLWQVDAHLPDGGKVASVTHQMRLEWGGSRRGRERAQPQVSEAEDGLLGLPAQAEEPGCAPSFLEQLDLVDQLLTERKLDEAREKIEALRPGLPEVECPLADLRVDVLEGRLLLDEGRLVDVDELIGRLKVPSRAPQKLAADLLYIKGSVAYEVGQPRRARRDYEKLLELDRALGNPRLLASDLYMIAGTFVDEAAGEEDREAVANRFRTALAEAEEVEGAELVPGLYIALGKLVGGAEGRAFLEHGLVLATVPEDVVTALGALAVERLREDPAEATRLLDRALEVAEKALQENDNPWPMLHLWSDRLPIRWATLPREEAIADSQLVLGHIEAVRQKLEEPAVRAGLFSVWAEVYQWLAGRLLEDAGDPSQEQNLELAFHVMERYRARVLVDSLTAAGAKVKDQDHFARLDEITASLADDEALLAFQMAPWRDVFGRFAGGSWLMTVSREGARAYRLGNRGALERKVRVYLGLLAKRGSQGSAAARLYQLRISSASTSCILAPTVSSTHYIPSFPLYFLPPPKARTASCEPRRSPSSTSGADSSCSPPARALPVTCCSARGS